MAKNTKKVDTTDKNEPVEAVTQTILSPAQALQNEADQANTDLAIYLDLYPEAGFEFAEMPFEEICATYQRLQDADEQAADAADSLADKFETDFAEDLRVYFTSKIKELKEHTKENFPLVNLTSYDILHSNKSQNITFCVMNGAFLIKCENKKLEYGLENSHLVSLENLHDSVTFKYSIIDFLRSVFTTPIKD